MIRLASFAGEVPRLTPRLLPANHAQIARNTRLKDGTLSPIRQTKLVHTLPAPAQTIYHHGSTWLSWPTRVYVVPGPVAGDRLYVTGDGVPKVIDDGVTYPLALPFPGTALTATHSAGVVDPDTQYAVIYSYTWVTELDEESEPSPPSNEVAVSPDNEVTLTGFLPAPSGRAVDRMRIYRSQTGASGSSDYYFIKELPAATTSFVDVLAANPIQEPISSTSYNAPPDALNGLIALPNGMMAAFVGKQLYFCEPYKPHAWPEKYILTTDYPIVGLGAYGSTIAVMTQGSPYIAQGTAPENMTMERLEVNLPCIDAWSIVDLGYSIAYASNDGIVIVGRGGAALATRTLITREEWLLYRPDTMLCSQHDGRYLAAYSFLDEDAVRQDGILIFDFSGDQPFVMRADGAADALYYEIATSTLFMVLDDIHIHQWDAGDQDLTIMLWRSKRVILPGHVCFGAILIETIDGDGGSIVQPTVPAISVGTAVILSAEPTVTPAQPEPPPDPDVLAVGATPVLKVRVYADGALRDIVTVADQAVRLHSGFLATAYEVEVEGNVAVTAISLAASPSELAVG